MSVDPHEPTAVTAARLMGAHVAQKAMQLMRAKGRAREVLILGAAARQDSSELHGSCVPSLVAALQELLVHVELCEPHASLAPEWFPGATEWFPGATEIVSEDVIESRIYDGIIVTVAHEIFKTRRFTDALGQHMSEGGILLDVPGMYKDQDFLDRAAGGTYWHLG